MKAKCIICGLIHYAPTEPEGCVRCGAVIYGGGRDNDHDDMLGHIVDIDQNDDGGGSDSL